MSTDTTATIPAKTASELEIVLSVFISGTTTTGTELINSLELSALESFLEEIAPVSIVSVLGDAANTKHIVAIAIATTNPTITISFLLV